MIKVSFSYETETIKKHLAYIACFAKNKRKELVLTNISKQNINKHVSAIYYYNEPKRAGQRQTKRKTIRMIASWLGSPPDKQTLKNIINDLLQQSKLDNMYLSYAVHQKLNRLGEQTFHVHFCFPVRDKNGEVEKMQKARLAEVKRAYINVSKKYNLEIGYDEEKLHKKQRPRRKKQLTKEQKAQRAKWARRNAKRNKNKQRS